MKRKISKDVSYKGVGGNNNSNELVISFCVGLTSLIQPWEKSSSRIRNSMHHHIQLLHS